MHGESVTDGSTRRGFLRAVGVAGVAGVAGCAGLEGLGGSGDPDPAPVAEFRRDRQRRGYAPETTVPGSVTKTWRVRGINVGNHTAAKSSPVPDGNGNLVVAGDTGKVHSITPGGRLNWVASTFPSSFGVHATPAVANGTVYVGAYDGALYAFDAGDGSRKWRTSLGDAIGGSPAYVDGTIYTCVEYGDPSGALFGVDPTDGSVTFEDDRIADQPHSTPGVDRDVGTLSVGANDGYVYTWRYPELEFDWKFDAGGAVKSPVATHDGAAFFGSWEDAVFRVDLETGEQDWRFDTGGKVMTATAVDTDEGVVYTGSHDRNVYAIDAATGDEVWSHETGDWVIGSAVVTADSVLVGSTDGSLYALAKDTGDRRWAVENAGHVTCEPRVHDGAIYYTDRASGRIPGDLYRLDPDE